MTTAPDTPAEPLRGPLWPFPPELLEYPSQPPCARPVGRVIPPADAEPALLLAELVTLRAELVTVRQVLGTIVEEDDSDDPRSV